MTEPRVTWQYGETSSPRHQVIYALTELTRAELVKGLEEREPAYLFKHALAQARKHLSFILEQTPIDLRDTFLEMPAVREVLA